MALGRLLVEELGLEPGVDTLGRWMAHHVAELITRADQASNVEDRADAEHRAVDTILRIWEHRAANDRINPLVEIAPVLRVLQTLAQENPPWSYARQSKLATAAHGVYDQLRHLVILLSLLSLDNVETLAGGIARANRAAAWQSEEELELLRQLTPWIEPSTTAETKQRPASSKARSKPAQLPSTDELTKIVQDRIDELEAALADLRQSLRTEQT